MDMSKHVKRGIAFPTVFKFQNRGASDSIQLNHPKYSQIRENT